VYSRLTIEGLSHPEREKKAREEEKRQKNDNRILGQN
jgi:hypothetical protein